MLYIYVVVVLSLQPPCKVDKYYYYPHIADEGEGEDKRECDLPKAT